MSDRIEVHTTNLYHATGRLEDHSNSAYRVAEALQSQAKPAENAFGNGAAGQGAHAEFVRTHAILTDLTTSISRSLEIISASVSEAARRYDAAQAHALDVIQKNS